MEWRSPVSDIALQPDGKIVIAGGFSHVHNSFNTPGIARSNPNGSLDLSFNAQYPPTNRRKLILLQPDGRLWVSEDNSPVIRRLNPDGQSDATFISGLTNGVIYAWEIQPDGKVLIGGSFTNSA